MTGLQAELAIRGADACPVAAVSADTEPIRNVEWTGNADGGAVERFAVAAEDAPTGQTDAAATDDPSVTNDPNATDGDATDTPSDAPAVSMEPVFADETTAVVEFERDWDGCVCEAIEAAGCPVESVEARDGELAVTVHTRSRERLKRVIAAARQAAESVSLNYVVTGVNEATADPVVVDRGQLTDRQREVLTVAYEAGYFAHPREANAETVAAELDIAPSTFREHLAAAQAKLLGSVLE